MCSNLPRHERGQKQFVPRADERRVQPRCSCRRIWIHRAHHPLLHLARSPGRACPGRPRRFLYSRAPDAPSRDSAKTAARFDTLGNRATWQHDWGGCQPARATSLVGLSSCGRHRCPGKSRKQSLAPTSSEIHPRETHPGTFLTRRITPKGREAMSTQTGFAPLLQSTGKALNLSMQKLWLTGNVLAMGARLWIRHEFVSQETHPVEVIYSFALPRDASLRRFRMSGENFQVNSELRPTAEAHRLYEEGIQAGSLSALARHYGDGIVNLSVGNIRPKEKVVVLLELLAGVELHDGSLRLRFPFTLAPSYHAQARAAEIAPGVLEMELPGEQFDDLILPHFEKNAEHLHQVGFCLDVQMAGAIQEIASPSHALRVQTIGEEKSRVSLSRESDLPDRDFVLDVHSKTSGASLFAGLDSTGKTRFAAVIPSTQFGQLHAGPRRLVILLDRSGSMQGTPIAQAKKAIEACLGALDEQDLFGVVAFSNGSQPFQPNLSKGSMDNRRGAQKFLQSIEAQGGTELASGLEAAANLLQGEPGDILIITDGQVFGTETILQRARSTGVRIHCLGIGSASQDRFLAQLASHTGGVSRFLTHNERVDLPAVELFASIGRPVAEDVAVTIEAAAEARILPEPN